MSPPPTGPLQNSEPIQLAFDEDCLICNSFIQFLANRDQNRRFLFAPLPPHAPQAALVVSRKGKLYLHSTAVLIPLRPLEAAGVSWLN